MVKDNTELKCPACGMVRTVEWPGAIQAKYCTVGSGTLKCTCGMCGYIWEQPPLFRLAEERDQ